MHPTAEGQVVDVVLTVVFYAALGVGVAAVAAAMVLAHRARWLWTATAGFAVAGVLGAASIGGLVLLVAVACAALAWTNRAAGVGEPSQRR